MASVLIVEDDYLQAEAMAALIRARGHAVCALAGSADEALRFARTSKPDVVLMDVRLGGRLDGIDAASLIGKTCSCGIVFVTGLVNAETAKRIGAAAPGAVTIMKPTTGPKLADAIDRALAARPPAVAPPPSPGRRRAS